MFRWQFAALLNDFFKFERLLLTPNAVNGKVVFRYVFRVDLRNDRG